MYQVSIKFKGSQNKNFYKNVCDNKIKIQQMV